MPCSFSRSPRRETTWPWRALFLMGQSSWCKQRPNAHRHPKEVNHSTPLADLPPVPWPRSKVLNVWVDDLTLKQLLAKLDSGVVFTLNPDHLYHLQRNPAFLAAYRQADFITCDSKYIYWSLGWIGRRIQEVVSGSDIVPTYCWHHRNNPNVKVFLLGAGPGIAHKALERINERCGRGVVIGAHSPSMNFVGDEAEIESVIQKINESGATALVVGLGAPKQEIWISRHRHLMPTVKVYMGVGATIDYEAGAVARAPRWMSRAGLEWAHRVATQPRRYGRRYLRNTEFFWLLLVDGMGRYKSPLVTPAPEAGAGNR